MKPLIIMSLKIPFLHSITRDNYGPFSMADVLSGLWEHSSSLSITRLWPEVMRSYLYIDAGVNIEDGISFDV